MQLKAWPNLAPTPADYIVFPVTVLCVQKQLVLSIALFRPPIHAAVHECPSLLQPSTSPESCSNLVF